MFEQGALSVRDLKCRFKTKPLLQLNLEKRTDDLPLVFSLLFASCFLLLADFRGEGVVFDAIFKSLDFEGLKMQSSSKTFGTSLL